MRKGLFSIMCAALVAAVSAAPSWSQTIGGTTAPRFAKEIFGGGANPALTLGSTEVTVTYALTSTTIAGAREADITFTLSEGTFADPPNLLAITDPHTPTRVTVTSTSGDVGSSSITYGLRATGPLGTAGSLVLTFSVPRITGVGSVLGAATPLNPVVSIGVTVAPASTTQPNTFPVFPAMTTPAGDRKHDIATSGPAARANPARFFPAAGATSTRQIIDITDRTKTVAGGAAVMTGAGPAAVTLTGLPANSRDVGVMLSRIELYRDAGALKADGTTAFLSDTEGDGNLIVTAEGPFGSGDILFFSTDAAYTASEALSVSGSTATKSLPLVRAAGGAFSSPGVFYLYYVPAATTIAQRTIPVSYRLDWTLEDNKYADSIIPAGPTAISFSGIQDVAYAYAVPNPGNADTGYLRIRCQVEGQCDVFLDCMDQDGVRIGNGNLAEVTIPGNTTMVYSSKTTLPTLLGVSSWEGRLACNVMSDKNISVQILTRSGGSLVNNTFISGLDPDPDSPGN